MKAAAVIAAVALVVLCRLHVTVGHLTIPALGVVVAAELAGCAALAVLITRAARSRPAVCYATGGAP